MSHGRGGISPAGRMVTPVSSGVPVALIVQKYGGSSVADAESIKRVAKRIVETRKAGNEVVVAVSAMGDTTDELVDLAHEVTPIPAPRELDMLLTAGERISMALLAMSIKSMGYDARSFTGSQAGMITDAQHGAARIVDVTPGSSNPPVSACRSRIRVPEVRPRRNMTPRACARR